MPCPQLACAQKTRATPTARLVLTKIIYAGENRSPIIRNSRLGESMAAAEVWDVDVLTAPALPLGSGAVSLLAMPLQLRLLLLLLSQWQLGWKWASALVCPRRPPRPKYRPGPNHTRYLVDPDRRTESKRCGQPSDSMHPGSPQADAANSE